MIDHHQDSVKSVNFYPSQHCLKSFNITLLSTTPLPQKHTPHPFVGNSTQNIYIQQNRNKTRQTNNQFQGFVCDNFPLFTTPPPTLLKQFFLFFQIKQRKKFSFLHGKIEKMKKKKKRNHTNKNTTKEKEK